ncbi:MAG TPA: UDP-3-O-(3-hydroxymyristoyl)glucosamine N-acyltransferase [Gemmatimonadota bacterium]|nr:UDP-3-O-(3-hydroxymyristoyl)glucosamine N-acyltransferase [Gemmatimonadota bacterium]
MARASVPLGELAAAIGARLEGNPRLEIRGVSTLEGAGPTDLSFLANARYEEAARLTNAGAIVVGSDYRANGQNVLRSDNPYLAFAQAIALLWPPPPVEPGVAPTAVVDATTRVPGDASIGHHAVIGANVDLGRGVVVGAGTVIEESIVIGEGSRLFPRVTLLHGTRLGKRCVVQSGSVLGADGFGYATDGAGRHHKVPQRGGLVLGDDVEIGAGVTIDRGSMEDTTIGDGAKIDNLVHIGHNVKIGKNAIIVAQVGVAGSTKVGDFVVVGGQAGIVGHVSIGDRARIGGQAGVIGDVPAGAEYSGYPARSHREQMRAHVLFSRLPEIFARLKAIEQRIRA